MSRLPVVIVLAAGRGERFAASGGKVHKLDALLGGKRVIDHVLEAVAASGLEHFLVTPDPERPGMGDSIAAGVKATADAAGWLILPADLPLISRLTLKAIALAPPSAVTVPRFRGQKGHPVRFAAEYGPDLMRLEGNSGAASIVRSQMALGAVTFIDTDDAGTVTDIDTLADLERAERLINQAPS